MKAFIILLLVTFLGACATKSKPDDVSSEKITITGTKIDRSEIKPETKLRMSLNKKNKSSNFMQALAGMQSLPQPKDIGDCKDLLSALAKTNVKMRILDENNVILQSEYGIYEYTFDDNSCPTNET